MMLKTHTTTAVHREAKRHCKEEWPKTFLLDGDSINGDDSDDDDDSVFAMPTPVPRGRACSWDLPSMAPPTPRGRSNSWNWDLLPRPEPEPEKEAPSLAVDIPGAFDLEPLAVGLFEQACGTGLPTREEDVSSPAVDCPDSPDVTPLDLCQQSGEDLRSSFTEPEEVEALAQADTLCVLCDVADGDKDTLPPATPKTEPTETAVLLQQKRKLDETAGKDVDATANVTERAKLVTAAVFVLARADAFQALRLEGASVRVCHSADAQGTNLLLAHAIDRLVQFVATKGGRVIKWSTVRRRSCGIIVAVTGWTQSTSSACPT